MASIIRQHRPLQSCEVRACCVRNRSNKIRTLDESIETDVANPYVLKIRNDRSLEDEIGEAMLKIWMVCVYLSQFARLANRSLRSEFVNNSEPDQSFDLLPVQLSMLVLEVVEYACDLALHRSHRSVTCALDDVCNKEQVLYITFCHLPG